MRKTYQVQFRNNPTKAEAHNALTNINSYKDALKAVVNNANALINQAIQAKVPKALTDLYLNLFNRLLSLDGTKGDGAYIAKQAADFHNSLS
jgi:hypothetical protein